MRSLGWPLIHYNWCFYKKRRLGHTQAGSRAQRTWVWANSGIEWRTEVPRVLQSMGSQRGRQDLVPGQQHTHTYIHGKPWEDGGITAGTKPGTRPQMKPTVPTPSSQISSLQNCEETNFHHTWSRVLCYGSPRKLIHLPSSTEMNGVQLLWLVSWNITKVLRSRPPVEAVWICFLGW